MRVDHNGGAYECVHFYNTTQPCSLIFNSKGVCCSSFVLPRHPDLGSRCGSMSTRSTIAASTSPT